MTLPCGSDKPTGTGQSWAVRLCSEPEEVLSWKVGRMVWKEDRLARKDCFKLASVSPCAITPPSSQLAAAVPTTAHEAPRRGASLVGGPVAQLQPESHAVRRRERTV